jgi:hypothetical protein
MLLEDGLKSGFKDLINYGIIMELRYIERNLKNVQVQYTGRRSVRYPTVQKDSRLASLILVLPRWSYPSQFQLEKGAPPVAAIQIR